jgi:hypothetical protein
MFCKEAVQTACSVRQITLAGTNLPALCRVWVAIARPSHRPHWRDAPVSITRQGTSVVCTTFVTWMVVTWCRRGRGSERLRDEYCFSFVNVKSLIGEWNCSSTPNTDMEHAIRSVVSTVSTVNLVLGTRLVRRTVSPALHITCCSIRLCTVLKETGVLDSSTISLPMLVVVGVGGLHGLNSNEGDC